MIKFYIQYLYLILIIYQIQCYLKLTPNTLYAIEIPLWSSPVIGKQLYLAAGLTYPVSLDHIFCGPIFDVVVMLNNLLIIIKEICGTHSTTFHNQ